MAGRFLRQFHWLDWSILAKRRKSQFEEKNSGQIAVSFGRTQLYVCKTKPTFATNEQTLGGKYRKSLWSCIGLNFCDYNEIFFTTFYLNLSLQCFFCLVLCLYDKANFCYNWTNPGRYVSKIFVKLHSWLSFCDIMRFFHKLPFDPEFATSYVVKYLCDFFLYNW